MQEKLKEKQVQRDNNAEVWSTGFPSVAWKFSLSSLNSVIAFLQSLIDSLSLLTRTPIYFIQMTRKGKVGKNRGKKKTTNSQIFFQLTFALVFSY